MRSRVADSQVAPIGGRIAHYKDAHSQQLWNTPQLKRYAASAYFKIVESSPLTKLAGEQGRAN